MFYIQMHGIPGWRRLPTIHLSGEPLPEVPIEVEDSLDHAVGEPLPAGLRAAISLTRRYGLIFLHQGLPLRHEVAELR